MHLGSLSKPSPFTTQDKGKWIFEEDHGGTYTVQTKHQVVDIALADGTASANTGVGTATITLPNFIPANSIILGMTARIITVFAGASLSTWSLGVTGTTDKYGTTLAKTLGTTVKPSDHKSTVTGPHYQAATINVLFTAAAGQFDTGKLRIVLWYETITAPTQ